MSKKHTVRTTNWKKNVLISKERIFEEAKEALDFAKKVEEGIVKVYDEVEQLIFSTEINNTDSYA